MPKKLQISLLTMLIFLAGVLPVWAQEADVESLVTGTAGTAGFLLLLPFGLILFLSSSLPQAERSAPQTAAAAMVVWAIAAVAYFGVGFAFQFGGLAVYNSHPDFAELYWNWSPLNSSYGQGWGFIGLRGWALLGPAATLGVYDLFLRHLAFVGVVTIAPTFILYQRARTWMLLVFGLLAGTLIYPLATNWIWSGGWLANLGLNRGLGHGFVDAGVGSVFVIAGTICLAALIFFKRPREDEADTPTDDNFIEVPMPSAYLPLLSLFGMGMILWSWTFIATAQHIPTAVSIAMPRAALNGILSAMAALLLSALYSRFTTAEFNPLMTARGGLTGLIIMSAAAPFVTPWQAIAVGAAAGLLLPLLIYTVDNILYLNDHTAGVVMFGLMGLLSWLLVAFLADGSSGAGWNVIGEAGYLGAAGQGVSGLAVAAGYVSDWPGQLNAQLIGAAAIIGWTFLIAAVLFAGEAWLLRRYPSTNEPRRPGN